MSIAININTLTSRIIREKLGIYRYTILKEKNA